MKEKCLSCGTPFTSCHLEAPYLCVKCADLAVRQTRACDLFNLVYGLFQAIDVNQFVKSAMMGHSHVPDLRWKTSVFFPLNAEGERRRSRTEHLVATAPGLKTVEHLLKREAVAQTYECLEGGLGYFGARYWNMYLTARGRKTLSVPLPDWTTYDDIYGWARAQGIMSSESMSGIVLSDTRPGVKYHRLGVVKAKREGIDLLGLSPEKWKMKISRSGELTIIPPRINFDIRGLPWV